MDELKKLLSTLEITISFDGEDEYTVFTTSEPLFCFVCTSPEEAVALVQDTLLSYARTFYRVEEIPVELRQEAAIPVKKLTPYGYVRPFIAPDDNEGQLAFA